MSSSSSTVISSPDYESWMGNHPSAIQSFRTITKQAKDKQIALFLDYDGTLSPIVSDPDSAFMSDEMRSVLKELTKYYPISIISGRSRRKVVQFVKLNELYYAGSHGMDIAGPEGSVLYTPDSATEIRRTIDQVCRLLKEGTEHIKGATVENNVLCCSVHYRNVVHKESQEVVKRCVHHILTTCPEFGELELNHGLKVLEIRPKIEWNKGNAVEYLIESLGLEDIFPIYIGDDRTDEDAFRVLPNHGGCGILVSSVPKETEASYSLRNPLEVMEFLEGMIWNGKETVH